LTLASIEKIWQYTDVPKEKKSSDVFLEFMLNSVFFSKIRTTPQPLTAAKSDLPISFKNQTLASVFWNYAGKHLVVLQIGPPVFKYSRYIWQPFPYDREYWPAVWQWDMPVFQQSCYISKTVLYIFENELAVWSNSSALLENGWDIPQRSRCIFKNELYILQKKRPISYNIKIIKEIFNYPPSFERPPPDLILP
jgi:hypothetical protein